ncbi:DUF2125 domain-containing protein [Psychromarinibacter sp. S121]|uniref:DUF2125 domain-containing protein n=1 Tax=Psychromarinibacter sp. S121 TaxID=3415127 RepID=UPI003C7B3AF0
MKHAPLSLAAFTLFPLAAAADVTPQDVWANMSTAMNAMGAEVTADVAEDGATMTVSDMVARFTFPNDTGSFEMHMGDMVLTGRDDGTVLIELPASQDMTFGGELTGEGGFSATMRMDTPNYLTTATGEPGDVTYHYELDEYDMTFTGLELTGDAAEEMGTPGITGTMRFEGMKGFYRIWGEDVVRMSMRGTMETGAFDMGFSFTSPDGDTVTQTNTATMGAMESSAEVAIPQGTSVMALGQALRDGLMVSYEYRLESQESRQEQTMNGEPMGSQSAVYGMTDGSLGFSADGLNLTGRVEGYEMEMFQPMIVPMPLQFAIAAADGSMSMPVLSSEEAVDSHVRLNFEGLTIGDSLWGMFDPAGQLPRDPAQLVVDMTAKVKLLFDMVDYEQLVALEDSDEVPAEVSEVGISEIRLNAVGADLMATGGFTLDNSDLETFGGFPATDGAATVTLKGFDALLDTLIGMGLVPEDQAGMARMMLGGFAQKDDEGTYSSEIVIDGETGQISANGQRIR